jgi:pilus assembly protein Flp/PilA
MKHLSREEGQGLVEYALILVLVAIVVIAILLMLGPVIGNVFSNITEALLSPGSAGGGGSTSVISSVSATESVGTLTIRVNVTEKTRVSVSGGVNHSGQECVGFCQFEFTGYPSSGSATVTAGDGSSKSVSW